MKLATDDLAKARTAPAACIRRRCVTPVMRGKQSWHKAKATRMNDAPVSAQSAFFPALRNITCLHTLHGWHQNKPAPSCSCHHAPSGGVICWGCLCGVKLTTYSMWTYRGDIYEGRCRSSFVLLAALLGLAGCCCYCHCRGVLLCSHPVLVDYVLQVSVELQGGGDQKDRQGSIRCRHR
jgi:hypothetical protein